MALDLPRHRINAGRPQTTSLADLLATQLHRNQLSHMLTQLIRGVPRNRDARFVDEHSSVALNNRFASYYYVPGRGQEYNDLTMFIVNVRPTVVDRVMESFTELRRMRVSLAIDVRYRSMVDNTVTRDTRLYSAFYSITAWSDIHPTVNAALQEIELQHSLYNEGKSDFTLDRVIRIKVSIAKENQAHHNIQGGGGVAAAHLVLGAVGCSVPTPKWLSAKKCTVNIQNKDQRCFQYVMELALMERDGAAPKQKQERHTNYVGRASFDFGSLTFPIHPIDIPLFEVLNADKYNVSINVYVAFEDKPHELQVVYRSLVNREDMWTVNLLMVTDDSGAEAHDGSSYHWLYVKNLQRLIRGIDGLSINSHEPRFVCQRCLMSYPSQLRLDKHQNYCIKQTAKRPVMPSPLRAFKYFGTVGHTVKNPFVIYADFEAFNHVLDHSSEEMSLSVLSRKTKHVASGCCVLTVCSEKPQLSHYTVYSTPMPILNDELESDVGDRFLEELRVHQQRIDVHMLNHFSHPLDRNSLPLYPTNVDNRCLLCHLDLEIGVMRHWLYVSYRRATDFDDYKQYWARRREMAVRPFPATLSDTLLAENRAIEPWWDPMKPRQNYLGHVHYACLKSAQRAWNNVPVVFHNLTGYDEHLIIKSLDLSAFDVTAQIVADDAPDAGQFPIDLDDPRTDVLLEAVPVDLTAGPRPAKRHKGSWNGKFTNFQAIPLSGDKFMSFTIRRGPGMAGLKFIDSFKHMSSSLEKLAKNLLEGGKGRAKFVYLRFAIQRLCTQRGLTFSEELLDLMMRKGEFPYEYFDGPAKFNDLALPPRDKFYSQLRNDTISPEDYTHAQNVWQRFRCTSMREYHDLYLLQDVMLLADVFEEFRRVSIASTTLDPTHYVSLPGLSGESGYLYSGRWMDGPVERPFEIQLLHDQQHDMYVFLEEMVRGGVSMTPGRYAKANHKFLADYDEKQPSKFLEYWDENNLYGYAMSELLPCADYRWEPQDVVDDLLLKLIQGDLPYHESCRGYIFEVDGYFPEDTHDSLRDFPPLPDKMVITSDMISPHAAELNDLCGVTHDGKSKKLVCTLLDRSEYTVHYRNLLQAVKLGFRVTKVTRVLSFVQKAWLKPYIDYNTQKRSQALTDFEKDFYKLVVNSFYGKTIQNNHKHRSVMAVHPGNVDDKSLMDVMYDDHRIINSNLVLVYLKQGQVELNMPVMIGSIVLEHAKWLMYDFFYDKLKTVFGDRIRLLFTDTDSLCCSIETDDLMDDCRRNGLLNHMDLASWPNDASYHGANYHDPAGKKQLKRVKSEMVEPKPVYLTEVVALRSKMYSCLHTGNSNKATAKGVTRAVKSTITHDQYLACLRAGDNPQFQLTKALMTRINSVNNTLYTIAANKVTISPGDTKVWICDNGTDTYPYGHKATLSPPSILQPTSD